jgi:putative redox protein
MVSLALDWTGDLTFGNAPDSPAIALHSSTRGVPSPPEALAYAVMGCMGMDVVHVIKKGRHRLDALRVEFKGQRAPEPPKRFVSMVLTFDVTTSASAHVVERAIAMSREKYCSVWHTIRPDVEMSTAFVLRAPSEGEGSEAGDAQG